MIRRRHVLAAIGLTGAATAAAIVLWPAGNDTRHASDGRRAAQRAPAEWGWTPSGESEAERIFAADPVARSFFGHRKLTVEASGPWNSSSASADVIGGLLKVSVAKPIYGIHRIPGFVSSERGTFKLFKVDVAGARKFHVVVSFKRKRVVEISPLVEGSPRDPS